MLKSRRRPTPAGTILKAHYLEPRAISVTAFARAAGCSRKHMSNIVNGSARYDAGLAARIARVLGTSTELWINLQTACSPITGGAWCSMRLTT